MAEKMNAREIHDRFAMQREKLARLMKSEDGREALAYLEAKFGGDVATPDPYRTHVRIGERRVIDYLKELREENDA